MLAGRVSALDPGIRISQYQKSYWAVEQGLPHSYVTAIAQSREGLLWVGTDEGLARFDGLSFRPPAEDFGTRLGQAWVSALLKAKDGSLWIGTFDGELVNQAQGGKKRVFSIGGSVFALIEDPEGRIWASCRNGVFRVSGGRAEKQQGLLAPLDTSWNVLAGDPAGRLWVVDSTGLKQIRDGGARMMIPNSGPAGSILTALASRAGEIWLGTSNGLFRSGGPGGAGPHLLAGIRGPVVSLLEDRDGCLWAGTWGQGLYRVAGGTVERWSGGDGLPDDFVRTLAEDSEGNLWIGMRSGGLGRWQQPRLVPYGTPEGLQGNYATTAVMDPSGILWLGTWRGGLYKLIGGRPAPQQTPLPVSRFTVRAMAFDRTGRPWIGNWEGLYEFDGTKFVHRAPVSSQPLLQVSALHFDGQGRLWAGTDDQGLLLFDDGKPGSAPRKLTGPAKITALMADSTGRVWIGTNHGFGYCRPDGQAAFQRRPELARDSVKSFFEDSRRRIWVATANGTLLVFGNGRSIELGTRNGLPRVALHRVLEADGGSYWVSTARGILELRRGAIEEAIEGRRRSLDIVQYGLEDGMRTTECHGLSQPAGWKDAEGGLWFPTARGFVQVRPEQTRRLDPPKVRIEGASIESGALALGAGAHIEAGARNLELRFTALRLTRSSQVQFRYRMDGFDPDWVDCGNQRVVSYNQLPPGEHAFQVQARDPGGEWGSPATLVVTQLPLFRQTPFFYFLLAAGATGLVLAGYHWRLHSVRSRYAAILEERNRIGREWHDTLVAGFSAISLQLEAAMAQLTGQPGRSAEILDVTRRMVHHYRAEARRVIWDLRDNRPEGESLEQALDMALKRVTEDRGIESEVVVTGSSVELPLELRHNALRIAQEAIANAARHAAPSRIGAGLHYEVGTLRVVVEDDGRGFDTRAGQAEVAGHFGLAVMQERARRHGGKVRITSAEGKGTIVEAILPMQADETK